MLLRREGRRVIGALLLTDFWLFVHSQALHRGAVWQKAKVVVALLVTIAAVTLSGYGTFGELCCMHGRFYGGVQNDVEWLKESSPAAQGPRGCHRQMEAT